MSIFDNAFNRPESFFKTTTALAMRQEIKTEHRVNPSSPGRRTYATGLGLALGLFLTGEMDICQNAAGEEFTVKYQSKSKGSIIGVSRKNPGVSSIFHWSTNQDKPFDHMASACAMAMIAGLLDATHFPLTHGALRKVAALTGFPANKDELILQAENNPVVVGAIHYLSDALYTEAGDLIAKDTVNPSTMRENSVPVWSPLLPAELAKVLGVWREPLAIPRNTPKEQLLRLARRGGAALLVGPPATFKTTAARKVAVAQQYPVVEMQGNTGVEDRDLLGTFMRAPGGETTWVDGPLPQVFSYAARGPVVAIIDEIMRFIPETTAIFITVMNQLDYEDCELLLRPALEHPGLQLTREQVEAEMALQLPERHERYHMLKLPTGDVMFALARNITWIATTNLGENFLQASAGLDPALMSRFDLVIDVPRADPEDVLPIYQKVAGQHENLWRFAADLEDLSYDEMKEGNSLLERPLDPRKMIAFIKDAACLIGDGQSFRSAVMVACSSTVVPHVCPREADGSLNEVSVARIYEIITDDALARF